MVDFNKLIITQSKCDTQHSENAKNKGNDEEKQSMYKRKKKGLLNLTPFHKCQWGGYGGIKRKQECALQKSKAMMDPYSKRSRIEKDTNKEQVFFGYWQEDIFSRE